jgi:hypothetical protein
MDEVKDNQRDELGRSLRHPPALALWPTQQDLLGQFPAFNVDSEDEDDETWISIGIDLGTT